ncbi:MAG: hypothetical protein M1830_010022 [Pleopsidium flavum]|nr:MAG: hypothetical protein M1830_010022 [Pleopsidium flavum]
MPLSEAVIAIAGAGSGIGQGVAKHLADLGAHLSLADLNFESVENDAKSIRAAGGKCIAFQIDVRDTAAVNNWIQTTVDVFGSLNGAVNCAGVFSKDLDSAPIMAKTDEEWDFVIGINLTGMFKCLRAQLSSMAEGGSVVNVTSTVGLIGLPYAAPYSVSKHGASLPHLTSPYEAKISQLTSVQIIGLTRTAAKECASKNIRVNAVAPAAIETPMLGPKSGRSRQQLMDEVRGHTPMNRIGTVEEVAKTVSFLLSSDSSFTTGAVYTIDGGMTS